MGTIADHLRALRDQVEFYDALSDFIRLVDAVEELERVNDDLEDQIFEEGGFIMRIVELEEENARLRVKFADIEALLTAKGDDLSCAGLWIGSEGCYAGELAERILKVLHD